MKVAVTGATGFIGSHLIPILTSIGWDVQALIKAGKHVKVHRENAQAGRIRIFPVDITSGKGLKDGLSRAEVIVHLAARNHIIKDTTQDPLIEYRRVNVDGTRIVAKSAGDCGARLFIHFSSVKAMGEAPDVVMDEDSPGMPTTPYGVSKLESEKVVQHELERKGICGIIVRLPMVYGPGNKGNLPRMIRWAEWGLPFPLFQPDNLRSMVYVGNVVAGIVEILKHPPAATTTYIIKDREDYSTRNIYSTICRELGRRPLFLKIPAPIVKIGGMVSDDFRKVTGSFRVSAKKIEKELGFSPPFSLDEGISRTVRWYKDSTS